MSMHEDQFARYVEDGKRHNEKTINLQLLIIGLLISSLLLGFASLVWGN